MLKPELARQQLTALASPKHSEGRLNRLKKLPKSAAAIALNLLGRQATGKPFTDYQQRVAAAQKAAATLEAKPGDRAKVIAALFPTIAAAVEAGWQLFARLPYTLGYERRSFRAPGRPEAYRIRRQAWIEGVFETVARYPDDALSPEWLAAWAVHLDDRNSLGYLLAAAIDRGDDAVFEIIKDSAASRHEIGGPGQHTTRALLASSRPDAWEFAESLLIAAQRQEGLRQNILEAVDEAHPDAFRRMLRLLLDRDLLRFSSVARAAGVWLGEDISALAPKKLKADLNQLHTLLEDAKAREAAVTKGDPLACYRGLWCLAFIDVDVAAARARSILKDKAVGRRYAAGKLLASTGLPEVGTALLPLLDDPDPRLVSLALTYYRSPMTYGNEDESVSGRPKDLFERLEKAIPRLPEKEITLKPIAEGWGGGTLAQEMAANLLPDVLDPRPAERLLPYLPLMGDWPRVHAIAKLVEPRTLTDQVRGMLLAVAGHPSGNLREAALKGLQKCKVAEDEARTLEGYLTRKNADLRRGLFDLLLNRTDKAALGSVERLLTAKDANQRLAGLELARRMTDAERQTKAVREAVTAFRDRLRKLAKPEAEVVDALLNPRAKPATLDDCLGLIKPGERTAPTPPKKRKVKFATPAAATFVRELDAFIHEHKDRTFTVQNYDKSGVEVVLGSAYSWHFRLDDDPKNPRPYPLVELWEQFWTTRSPRTRDADGLEVLRARGLRIGAIREGEEELEFDDEYDDDDDVKVSKAEAAARNEIEPLPPVGVRYQQVIEMMIAWFIRQYPPAGAADFLLDAVETSLSLVPQEVLARKIDPNDWRSSDWRDGGPFIRWVEITNAFSNHIEWKPAHAARLYGLLRWVDEPGVATSRHRPDVSILFAAFSAEAATVADFIDELIGPRTAGRSWYSRNFRTFNNYTTADERTKDALVEYPELRAAVERCRDRVLDVELTRGETPSAATEPAKSIGALFGQLTLFRLLRALGKGEFKKSSYSVGDNKPSVLTELVKNCHPLPDNTPEVFAAAAKAAIAAGEVPEARIVELALLNPRWVAHVERTIGWTGFSEAVWWFIAHTRNAWDEGDNEPEPAEDGEEKPANAWAQIVKARTNLTAEQRSEGIIDVAWFHAAYKAVGKDSRWDAIESAAKFLGYGQGHKKAARLADVLLGRTKKKELIDGIRQKNLKEYVRLLGLLPLPEKPAARETELMDRHKVLKEYERYARGLSSMSREPAMQAARLGLENLAVTANYPDPLRLEWAAGARAVADLLKGPIAVTVKNVTVTLALGDLGTPELMQTKDAKEIKSLPPDVKKNPKVAELVERRNDLKKAAASTRRSLEQAMCQGDPFTADEVQQLMGHALVRPVLERLVLAVGDVRGYPTQDGKSLRDHAGKSRPIPGGSVVTIAHPTDLLAAGDWPEWQAECFRAERLQPFKQVFRELYAVTAQEKDDGTKSQRYAGQQLNPTQAMALFGTRGWSTKEGVDKMFREAGLTAAVRFDQGWTTPGEVEGLTFHSVQFHRRGDWKPVLLMDVPVRVFSEVMRDLDLVVSVAHVGGVDPEASASTVDMRAMLLRETCSLLKVGNVKLDSRHAMIQGTLGSYSVHLGSGVVHKQPGGSLCIVPVHSQHRGRLFLPFADDDPRTAEVVSKVLLLARDQEIQDPTILEQIAGK